LKIIIYLFLADENLFLEPKILPKIIMLQQQSIEPPILFGDGPFTEEG